MDSAKELSPDDPADVARVSSVEKCDCPPGYTGSSCEDCAMGYYQKDEGGVFGAICLPCNCHGHSDFCHPLTGDCVRMKILPGYGPGIEDGGGMSLKTFFTHMEQKIPAPFTHKTSW